jgi:hypothetical protein
MGRILSVALTLSLLMAVGCASTPSAEESAISARGPGIASDVAPRSAMRSHTSVPDALKDHIRDCGAGMRFTLRSLAQHNRDDFDRFFSIFE